MSKYTEKKKKKEILWTESSMELMPLYGQLE